MFPVYSRFRINWLLTLSDCEFVGWSRQNECLGLCGYCYSVWLWWGYGIREGVGVGDRIDFFSYSDFLLG
jgi:hypothetical protein